MCFKPRCDRSVRSRQHCHACGNLLVIIRDIDSLEWNRGNGPAHYNFRRFSCFEFCSQYEFTHSTYTPLENLFSKLCENKKDRVLILMKHNVR